MAIIASPAINWGGGTAPQSVSALVPAGSGVPIITPTLQGIIVSPNAGILIAQNDGAVGYATTG